MDLINSDVREISMSKYVTKKSIPYWIIAVLVVLIAIILAIHFKANETSKNTAVAPIEKVSSSSSSQTKYVAGKDYKITYSNTGVIDKATLDKALKNNYLNDIDSLMSTKKPSGLNMAKVEVYYNKDKNLLVERLFENGYKDNQPTHTVGYDLETQDMNPEKTFPNDYRNQPLVYTWEKLK